MQDILLVRQKHQADRAGLHFDYRIVIGDKAYSWATKKGLPDPGKSIVLHEQPIHDAKYATSKRIVIPKGQYGAGVTELDYAQRGKAEIEQGKYVLHLNDGTRFLIKHMPNYGAKQWLFLNISGMGKGKGQTKMAEENVVNRYLEKVAVSLELHKHKQTGKHKWYIKGAKTEAGYGPTGIKAHKHARTKTSRKGIQLTVSKAKVTASHPRLKKSKSQASTRIGLNSKVKK